MTELYTREGEVLDTVPWQEYPRPLLKRDSYINLNGEWEFSLTQGDGTPEYEEKILVPFAVESMLSGIGKRVDGNNVMWYRRRFTLPQGFLKERLLLNIGAADRETTVFLNGKNVGAHVGGYEGFTVELTDALEEENELVIRVTDDLDPAFPYGKQCKNRGGMWYTPVSGIWQSVWLESVSDKYISELNVEYEDNTVNFYVNGVDEGNIEVQTPYGEISCALKNGKASLLIEKPRMWSPEDPYLYYYTVVASTDRVSSYFALRTLSVSEENGVARLCLNGKPYFFHGLLDQGYWSDGLFTPATPTMYETEILELKKLGFNMLRKHIKIEPQLFYYACDRLGMTVFQDMVNNGKYSFLRDTALPTAGIRFLSDKWLNRDKKTREIFEKSMMSTIKCLNKHMCICYWTIFNEGWGQFCGSEMYDKAHALDSTRFIDTASGWFNPCKTDVDSRHVYFRKIKCKPGKKPLVISEFGGYSYKPDGHVFNTEQTYGYGKAETREQFVEKLRRLYTEEIIPLAEKGLSATVYTQVSDVEDETNGLFSYDRKVAKILPEEFRDISDKLCKNN